MEKQKIYNLIILDASGSMESIYQQALTGVNETIKTISLAQKEHEELDQYLTLASFSAGENFLNRIYTNLPVAECHEITEKDYPLLGCTALYDAMGTLISELQQKVTHSDRVLVTIITDGYENASRTWSGNQIKSLVEELRQMGWTFTYIGANQDVEKVATSMGVRNSMAFCADAAGTGAMFAMERKSRSRFYSKMSDKLMSGCCLSMTEEDGFFDNEDTEKEPPVLGDSYDDISSQKVPETPKKKGLMSKLFGK